MKEEKKEITPTSTEGSKTPVVPSPEKERHANTKRAFVVVAVLIVLALLVGVSVENSPSWQQLFTNNRTVTERPEVEDDGNLVATDIEADIANLVSEVSPSVVSITTQSRAQTYFGVAEQEGAGTGIVVSADGYILTNKHVIEEATAVGVVLSDGTRYDDVEVVGTDPLNDVAFLKVPDVNNLNVVELGNSSSIRVGQQVVAIGNSLGQYQNTVTSGIISGTGRPITAQSGSTVETLTDLLQTDAAINPGNSGGPLLNMSGQVIGMNTAVAADAQGIGFAIPINSVKGMLKGVLEDGEVERAFLGVNHIPVTPETAKLYDLPVQNGSYIYSQQASPIADGSPAEQAGIKERDIITQVNGVDIGTNGALTTLIGEYRPGDTIELTVVRAGTTQSIKVTLATYDQS